MCFKIENVHVGQIFDIQKIFPKIITEFDRIIEIGTDRGGLSLYLYKLNEKLDIISYDIRNVNDVPLIYKEKIKFMIGDCFVYENEISNMIQDKNKRVLLFCDGGDKIKEFITFSKYLKSNDVIMCHDFEEDKDSFKNITLSYNWKYESEITINDISKSIIENNLQPYYYNEFKNCIIGSFIKK